MPHDSTDIISFDFVSEYIEVNIGGLIQGGHAPLRGGARGGHTFLASKKIDLSSIASQCESG